MSNRNRDSGAAPQAIEVIGDALIESDETLLIKLAEPVGLELSRNVAVGTILDDDAPPALPSLIATLSLASTGDDANTSAPPLPGRVDRQAQVNRVARPGNFLAHELSIQNVGDSPAQLVRVELTGGGPQTLVADSFACSTGQPSTDGSLPTVEVSSLAPGETVLCAFAVEVLAWATPDEPAVWSHAKISASDQTWWSDDPATAAINDPTRTPLGSPPLLEIPALESTGLAALIAALLAVALAGLRRQATRRRRAEGGR